MITDHLLEDFRRELALIDKLICMYLGLSLGVGGLQVMPCPQPGVQVVDGGRDYLK